jgi:flagellar assembly protein FliH
VAARILRREVTVDPGVLLGVVKAALEKCDTRDLDRIRMHPEDAPALQRRIDELGLPPRVAIIPDGALQRGEIIFETSRGALDASILTQLEEVERGLCERLDVQPHSRKPA